MDIQIAVKCMNLNDLVDHFSFVKPSGGQCFI